MASHHQSGRAGVGMLRRSIQTSVCTVVLLLGYRSVAQPTDLDTCSAGQCNAECDWSAGSPARWDLEQVHAYLQQGLDEDTVHIKAIRGKLFPPRVLTGRIPEADAAAQEHLALTADERVDPQLRRRVVADHGRMVARLRADRKRVGQAEAQLRWIMLAQAVDPVLRRIAKVIMLPSEAAGARPPTWLTEQYERFVQLPGACDLFLELVAVRNLARRDAQRARPRACRAALSPDKRLSALVHVLWTTPWIKQLTGPAAEELPSMSSRDELQERLKQLIEVITPHPKIRQLIGPLLREGKRIIPATLDRLQVVAGQLTEVMPDVDPRERLRSYKAVVRARVQVRQTVEAMDRMREGRGSRLSWTARQAIVYNTRREMARLFGSPPALPMGPPSVGSISEPGNGRVPPGGNGGAGRLLRQGLGRIRSRLLGRR